jgi:hypothetical protein
VDDRNEYKVLTMKVKFQQLSKMDEMAIDYGNMLSMRHKTTLC